MNSGAKNNPLFVRIVVGAKVKESLRLNKFLNFTFSWLK